MSAFTCVSLLLTVNEMKRSAFGLYYFSSFVLVFWKNILLLAYITFTRCIVKTDEKKLIHRDKMTSETSLFLINPDED